MTSSSPRQTAVTSTSRGATPEPPSLAAGVAAELALLQPQGAAWRSLLLRELRIGLPICVGVALFLTVVFRDSFSINLVFSLCIGFSIQGLTEVGRHGMARWLRKRLPGDPALLADWPGWAFMAPWSLISVVIGYLGGARLAGWLTGVEHLHKILNGNLRALVVIAVVVLTVTLGTTGFFYLRGRMVAFEALAEAARRQAAEAQLRLLQSQLEPHMLFNTLANLRVLIALDPPQAQAMLDRLIAFLRATLSASRAEHHPLAAEFDRLADYLALMAIRMGPRLQVELDLPEALRALPVPPLLLQPLVENAIQHGLEPKVEGGRLTVRARRDGDQLVLTVLDTGVGLPEADPNRPALPASDPGRGFGTTQVRERLATRWNGAARFELRPARAEDVAEHGAAAHSPGPDATPPGGTLARIVLPLP